MELLARVEVLDDRLQVASGTRRRCRNVWRLFLRASAAVARHQ